MRALCGSIITAGALIGWGLAALGTGIRYQGMNMVHTDGTFANVQYGAPSLMIALVVLFCAILIGLGIAFLGLLYHHERRYREHLHMTGAGAGTRSPLS